MNREKIIQMAREAGINVSQGHLLRFAGVEDDLEKFAAAIRAATKEEDARICEAESADMLRTGDGCRDGSYDRMSQGADSCAEAIRASK